MIDEEKEYKEFLKRAKSYGKGEPSELWFEAIKKNPIIRKRYIGESFYTGSGLTNGEVYEMVYDDGMYRVIDDEGEDYLYCTKKPGIIGGIIDSYWQDIEE